MNTWSDGGPRVGGLASANQNAYISGFATAGNESLGKSGSEEGA